MKPINTGTEADRLIGIGSGIAAKSAVTESRADANGVGTMTHIDAHKIPAGGTVSLEHGEYHVMFMGLTGPLAEAQMHKATLIFQKAGRVGIDFMIDPPVGQRQGGMDHSKMDHGTSGC